uniref:TauD/TfdA-like domain-containing protein n=1 Tax=Phaeomonas parva TaxID=124430 RepID=A0A7S1UCN5_9STRA
MIVAAAFPLLLLYHAVQKAMLMFVDRDYRPGNRYASASGPLCWLEMLWERLAGLAPALHPSSDALLRDAKGSDEKREVVVVDDFYGPEELQRVRRAALAAPMANYEKGWFSTANVPEEVDAAADGVISKLWTPSFMDSTRRRLEGAVGRRIDAESFASSLRAAVEWPGALHVKYAENVLSTSSCAIHTHSDYGVDGFAAIVYLDANASEPEAVGTSFWQRKSSGRMLEDSPLFDARISRYRCMLVHSFTMTQRRCSNSRPNARRCHP